MTIGTRNPEARVVEPGKEPDNPQWFRQVMGRYPTGVALISSVEEDGTPIGMIVGTFTSVSLDPPLIAFLPAKTSTSWPRIRATGRFAVNVLGATQDQVCRAFGGRQATKFEGIEWTPSPAGMPLLDETIAWMDCSIQDVFAGGDHDIVLGSVEQMDISSSELPLLFFQGGFGQFTPQTMVASEPDLAYELSIVDRARPEIEALATKLGCDCLIGGRTETEFILLASAGCGQTQWIPAVVGQRLPVAAPFGRTSMAWAKPADIDTWIAAGDKVDGVQAREILERIRDRGYSISVEGADLVPDVVAMDKIDPLRAMDPGQESVNEVAEGDVHSIAAPVFNGVGEPVLVVALYGLPKNLTQQETDRYVGELMATTTAISQALVESGK